MSVPQETKDLFTQNSDRFKELLRESGLELLKIQINDLLNSDSYECTNGKRGY